MLIHASLYQFLLVAFTCISTLSWSRMGLSKIWVSQSQNPMVYALNQGSLHEPNTMSGRATNNKQFVFLIQSRIWENIQMFFFWYNVVNPMPCTNYHLWMIEIQPMYGNIGDLMILGFTTLNLF